MSVIAALIALRVLVPLAVLGAAPAKLPLLPRYDYAPLNGDSFGFYETVANIFDLGALYPRAAQPRVERI